MHTRSIVAGALMAATIAFPAGVSARSRPRFEPTDLEWESPGVFEADVEFGYVRSPTTGRVVVPDFELGIGILDNVELNLGGSYALESTVPGSFSFDRPVASSLWPSLKIGIYDHHDQETQGARAIGVQVGPRIPVASGAHGLGFESLLVFGGSRRGLTVAFNLGAFVEPPADAVSRYALGVDAGVDLELALDSRERFQLTGELAGSYFFTADPNQLHTTCGITWTANPNLDLSVVGIFGILPGDDRYGVLFGFEPKLRLFDVSPPHDKQEDKQEDKQDQ
jgi:hypothetical protein